MADHSRTSFWTYALALLALLMAWGAHADPKWLAASDARESWRAALDRAKDRREPIMAFVFVENQKLTLMMEERTFGDIDVDKALRDFLCVKVNAVDAENQTFLEAYGAGRKQINLQVEPGHENDLVVEDPGRAQAYPITLFINPDGGLEHMVYGFVIPEDFAQMLGQVKAIMGLHERLRADEGDAKALGELGGLYVALQRFPAGRETLEKALAADADGKLGVGETALLDLAVAYLSEGQADEAMERIFQHLNTYPDSELRCKARFLLGGALLASVEPDRLAVEELTAQGKAAEAEQAAAHLLEGQRQAEEAWAWFEGEKGKAPCEGTEWSDYSLGALGELRAEMAYPGVSAEADALVAEGKIDAAVQQLRAFGTDKEKGHPGTDRGCEALFRAGEILMKAGKREEALAQWRKLADPDPQTNPCAQSLWRAQAMGAMQEP